MCKQFSDAHTSTFAQATAAQYLKSGRMPGTLAQRAQGLRRARAGHGRSAEARTGRRHRFTQPQGGLFFWARLTGAGGKLNDAKEFAKRAIEQGVAFVPGAPFYAKNPDLATLRLSFATADVGKIEEGIARLGAALGSAVFLHDSLSRLRERVGVRACGAGNPRSFRSRRKVQATCRTSSRRSSPPLLIATMASSRTFGLA